MLYQIADRVLNRPLFIHPAKADVILRVIEGRLPVSAPAETPIAADRFFGSRRRKGRPNGLSPISNGVAVISVVGSLVNRGAWIGANSGLVSYEGIAAQLRDAAKDPEVRAIVLDIDSYGGEAAGMAALADLIRRIDQEKPVWALVNDVAASAGYGIASSARRILISQTSMLGSIGVVLMHADFSKKLAKDGVAVTYVHAGAHKVDGNPYEPLPKSVRDDLQREINQAYDVFIDLVAAGRGSRLSADAARATEARVFTGADAISEGLADAIQPVRDAIAELADQTRPPPKPKNTRPTAGARKSDRPAMPTYKPVSARTILERAAEQERLYAEAFGDQPRRAK